jgi:hypothetical protein
MLHDEDNRSAGNATAVSENSAPHAKKRAALRCRLVAAAEVTERGLEKQISAHTSEIGLGGCYVDTPKPFPEGTLVDVRITRTGGVFQSEAKVVYAHANLGMGIAFTNLALDQRALLQNWIADLTAKIKTTC